MKRLQWTVLGLATVAGMWSMGCGGDEAPPPPALTTFEVRNGTWHVNVLTTYTGAESCLARASKSTDTTDVICNISLISGDANFPVTCEMDTSGDNISFNCRARVDLGICWQIADIVGSGTVNDTTFDIDFDLTQQITPKESQNSDACETFYGRFVDDCTAHLSSHGTWLTSGPTCSISGPSIVLPNSTKNYFTAVVNLNGLAEASYHWAISGKGSIIGSAAKDTVRVDATTAGKIYLTLDVGRGCSDHTCQDTVTVSAAASSGTLAPLTRATTREVYPVVRMPASELLAYLMRLALAKQ
jgi:hypothetical protein